MCIRDRAKQRRLAGSVGTQHREPFTGGHVELVDREDLAAAAGLPDASQRQDCAHAAARCCTDVSTALIVNASANRIPA